MGRRNITFVTPAARAIWEVREASVFSRSPTAQVRSGVLAPLYLTRTEYPNDALFIQRAKGKAANGSAASSAAKNRFTRSGGRLADRGPLPSCASTSAEPERPTWTAYPRVFVEPELTMSA